jgi:hypothetical protein
MRILLTSSRLLIVLFLCQLLSLVTGCVSKPVNLQATTAIVPNVYVTISDSADGFAEIAQRVVPEKLEGANIIFVSKPMTGTDLRLDLQMTYRNVTETEFETIWRTTTFLLATLYPSTCGHRAYMLTATLNDSFGHTRTYDEHDSTIAWLWLLHGPKCGDTPTAEEIETVANRMLDAVFGQMQKDDIFAEIASVSSETNEPLVHVDLNRAADIAAQVLTVDRSFARWAIGDQTSVISDYHIDMYFNVYSGSFSAGRAYLGIMTGGLTSPCRKSTVYLMTTVTGPGGLGTKSFLLTDSISGRMGSGSTDCETLSEATRPDVFTKLLRRAFRQIVDENLIHQELSSIGSSLPPLVHVKASRAEGIVRQETIRTAPFARYYFYDSTNYAPDYILQLDLQINGGGFKQLSTPKAIGAGLSIAFGVNLFCNPTSYTVEAVLHNRSGEVVSHYTIEKEFNFSGTVIGCHDDEFTNPHAFSELVRRLYSEMELDGTLARLSTRVGLPQ